jgi:hypothetical protein
MISLKTKLLILFCLSATFASANTYYVSNKGDDRANGRTQQTPWKTISKVNISHFSPGDSILFKREDVWREQLIIPSSGTFGNHIVFGSYGSGRKPRILGSKELKSWTRIGANIWRANSTTLDPTFGTPHNGHKKNSSNHFWPGSAFFIKDSGKVIWGHQQKYWPLSNLKVEYDWVWNNDSVYVYSRNDPGATYTSIEVAQRQSGIVLNDRSHITIEGFELQFFCSKGIDELYTSYNGVDLIVKDCDISYIGIKDGASAYGISIAHSEVLIQNCTIHDCGRRGISLFAVHDDTHIKNVVIEKNVFFNGFHTTGPDIQTYGTNSSIDNVIVRNNILYDNPYQSLMAPESYPSNVIFLQNNNGNPLTNVHIYNNIISDNTGVAIQARAVVGLKIYHNTIMGAAYADNDSKRFLIQLEKGTSEVMIKNNILFSDFNYSNCSWCGTSVFLDAETDHAEIDTDYNLYYHVDDRNRIVDEYGHCCGYRMDELTGLQSDWGWDRNSPVPQNPMFASMSDYHLQPGSPALGAGVEIPGYTIDFENNPVSTSPSIGALQRGRLSTNLEQINTDENKFILFPNPSSDYINIKIYFESHDLNIRILDLSGKKILEVPINDGQRFIRFPLELHPGVYIVQLNSGNSLIGVSKMMVGK